MRRLRFFFASLVSLALLNAFSGALPGEVRAASPQPVADQPSGAGAYSLQALPSSSDSTKSSYVPGQVILKFKSHATASEKAAVKQELRGRTLRKLNRIGAELVAIEGMAVEEAVKKYKSNSKVEYIEPNYIVRISALPNDPMFEQLWGMRNVAQTGGTYDADIDADEAWDVATGNQTILVGVLDTGVDYRHPDLEANIWTNTREFPDNQWDDDRNGYVDDVHGWDFCNDDSDPMDDHGHGTHLSGTIGAVGNNAVGVVGVCWRVKIVPIKFLNSNGDGTEADAISALEYAARVGVRVANCSWGDDNCSQAFMDAVDDAYRAGILMVASAGNLQQDTDVLPQYPASLDAPNVVSVAATNNQDNLAWFSNWGRTTVDLGAPGLGVLSTLPGNSYGLGTGTSMAAPHVTGAAALILSLHPEMSVDGVKAFLLEMADPVPGLYRKCLTGARLNVMRSLEGPDNVAPAAITGLVASNPGSNSMMLSWTATGDDGAEGAASYYEVRYSTSPITEDNFLSASRAWNEPRPAPSGSSDTMVVRNLACDTAYWFAVKVYDNQGNGSALSNVPMNVTLSPPDVVLAPGSLSATLFTGQTEPQTLTLSNASAGTLEFAVTGARLVSSADSPTDPGDTGRLTRDVRTSPRVAGGAGGQDTYGYRWTDSDQPDGPSFNWVDVSSVGTQVPMSGDDDNAGPYPIGFDFPFYEATFSMFRVCANGFISFTSTSGASANRPLPDSEAPGNLIAAWWNDLYAGDGHVYYHNDGTRLIVEFRDVTGSGIGGPYTFEIILYPTGRIVLQYLSMDPPLTGTTIGIQDAAGTDGLQVICDGPCAHDNLAVEFAAMPKWLAVSPLSGDITAGGSQLLTAAFEASGLAGGDYYADVVISSNDPDEPTLTVPTRLHVTPAPDIAVGGEVVRVASTKTYSKTGALTEHALESPVPAAGPVSLTVEVAGDCGDPSDETRVAVDGALLGVLGHGVGACDTIVENFTILPDRFDDFRSVGALSVTVSNSSGMTASCADSRHTAWMTYRAHLDSLDFEKVFVGWTDTLTAPLWNLGYDALELESVSTDSPEFTASVSSRVVLPGDSARVTVVFAPVRSGGHTATLTIACNDPDELRTVVTILGEGVERPEVDVTPDSLSDELYTGQVKEQQFTILNRGSEDLTFEVHTRPTSLGAAVKLEPSVPRSPAIPYDGGPALEVDVDHAAAAIPLTPETNTLGPNLDVLLVQYEQPFGSCGNEDALLDEGLGYEVITAEQLGSKNLDDYRFVLIASDQPLPDYAVLTAQRDRLEAYLAKGGVLQIHCSTGSPLGVSTGLVMPGGVGVSPKHIQSTNTVLISNHPLVSGVPTQFEGSLYHLLNLPPGAKVITADAMGRPTLVIYPFGSGTVLATTLPVEVGICGLRKHLGRIDRNMVAYAKSIAHVAWLTMAPWRGTIAPGASQLVSARFSAVRRVGDYYCDIVVGSNDPCRATMTVSVRMHVAAAPDIECAQTSVDCGASFVGVQSDGDTLIIENAGAARLIVFKIASSNPEFTTIPSSFILFPFSSRAVTVRVTPSAPGPRSGWLTIRCDDPDESEVRISLSGTGIPAPDVRVDPDPLVAVVSTRAPVTKLLSISNVGSDNLTFRVTQLLGDGAPRPSRNREPRSEEGRLEITAGTDATPAQRVVTGGGGPDAFGHLWIDSDQPGGPRFDWVDITSVGTRLPLKSAEFSDFIPIGFSFPFYDRLVTGFYASRRGFISFWAPIVQPLNFPLPDYRAPSDLVAAWWDDTYFQGDNAYYYYDGSRLIIEYKDVLRGTWHGRYTFETILYPDGTIIFQYLKMLGEHASATVGIQNTTKNDGLQVVYNTLYVHDSLAVKISTKIPSWLSITPINGLLPPGGRTDLAVTFDPSGLDRGDYYSSFKISSNDPIDSVKFVPVHMTFLAIDVAHLDLDPSTLNLGSNGQWVTGYIELPEGRDPADIKLETVLLDSTVSADPEHHCIDDYDGDGTADLMVKFSRSAVEELLSVGDSVIVTVTGDLSDGGRFVGTDTIRTISPHSVASPGGGPVVPGEKVQTAPWMFNGLRGERMLFEVGPNPMAGGAAIQLYLPAEVWVKIRVVNAAGAVVNTLVDGRLPPGRHNIEWTGRTQGGGKLAPGVYFCVLAAGEHSAVRKILLMR